VKAIKPLSTITVRGRWRPFETTRMFAFKPIGFPSPTTRPNEISTIFTEDGFPVWRTVRVKTTECRFSWRAFRTGKWVSTWTSVRRSTISVRHQSSWAVIAARVFSRSDRWRLCGTRPGNPSRTRRARVFQRFLYFLAGENYVRENGLSTLKQGYSSLYNSNINPSTLASFAGSAFRSLHSLVPSVFK